MCAVLAGPLGRVCPARVRTAWSWRVRLQPPLQGCVSSFGLGASMWIQLGLLVSGEGTRWAGGRVLGPQFI